jgi:hypothetical protein
MAGRRAVNGLAGRSGSVKIAAVLFDAGNTLLFLDYSAWPARSAPRSGYRSPHRASGSVRRAALQLERSDTSDRPGHPLLEESLPGQRAPEKLGWCGTRCCRCTASAICGAPCIPVLRGTRPVRQAGLRLGVVSNSDGRVEDSRCRGFEPR